MRTAPPLTPPIIQSKAINLLFKKMSPTCCALVILIDLLILLVLFANLVRRTGSRHGKWHRRWRRDFNRDEEGTLTGDIQPSLCLGRREFKGGVILHDDHRLRPGIGGRSDGEQLGQVKLGHLRVPSHGEGPLLWKTKILIGSKETNQEKDCRSL